MTITFRCILSSETLYFIINSPKVQCTQRSSADFSTLDLLWGTVCVCVCVCVCEAHSNTVKAVVCVCVCVSQTLPMFLCLITTRCCYESHTFTCAYPALLWGDDVQWPKLDLRRLSVSSAHLDILLQLVNYSATQLDKMLCNITRSCWNLWIIEWNLQKITPFVWKKKDISLLEWRNYDFMRRLFL